MPNWSLLLTDHLGSGLAELHTGDARRGAFARNAAAEIGVAISHDDDAAGVLFAALTDGIPKLRAYRDGVLRFHGDLVPFDEQLEEAASINLVFRDPFARLIGSGQGRGRFTDASETFTGEDAGQIVKSLIDDYGDGIDTTGTIEATKDRDRTYEYANVGEEIVNLTQVLDGFDFEIEPIEYAAGNIGRLRVYASQGQDRTDTVRFQYGPGTLANVRSVTRQTEPPINMARVLGAGGLVALKTDAASVATYGAYWVQESMPDVSVSATLNDKAQALLRPDPVRVVSFVPDPTRGPQPWDDYWLGDTVSFYGRRGAFAEDLTARVNAITVTIDSEGVESTEVQVEMGEVANGYLRRPALPDLIGDLRKRVATIGRVVSA